MADESNTTGRDAALTCVLAAVGIVLSTGAMLAYPCWAFTYTMEFFSALYIVGMVVHQFSRLMSVYQRKEDQP